MRTAAEVEEEVRAGGLLATGQGVVVLVSGGRDSICLLDLAVRIAGTEAVQALHVNYRLRGADSDADEQLCRDLCARLGVRLSVPRPGAPPAAGNVQAWARDVRYEAARRLARGEADVAAGHTATDQVETILYRLASSPSRRALLGMRPRAGDVVRPLLAVAREETGAYCRERGLAWREDSSNDSDAYARGRVRRTLVPALRAVHPAAERNVLSVAETLREEADVLDELVDGVLRGADTVRLDALRTLPPALARLVAQRLADGAAGRPAPGTARRVPEVLALRNGGALDLPHGLRAVVRGGILRFELRRQ